MEKFTKLQKEELLALLHIRLETIQDDPESADEFETVESLERLEKKIESGSMDFTEAEIKWIVEEAQCRQEIGFANQGNEGVKVLGLVRSMENVIKKVQR